MNKIYTYYVHIGKRARRTTYPLCIHTQSPLTTRWRKFRRTSSNIKEVNETKAKYKNYISHNHSLEFLGK